MSNTIYLGDGAYVEFTGYGFRIFTERAEGTHEVHLEPGMVVALAEFAKGKGVRL